MTPSRNRDERPGGATALVRLVAIALTVAAIVKELRTPRDERTWQGTIARFVPYDLRAPTPERARERLWSPDNPHVLVPTVFGVGWSINVGRLVALVLRTARD